MSFVYPKTIHLADTDAAGVVYFAKLLEICHEGYEESLAEFGINLQELVQKFTVAIPIVHAEADFFRPIFWRDRVILNLTPILLSETEFEVSYSLRKEDSDKALATGMTRHVCINSQTRKRVALPTPIQDWLQQASS